MAVSHSDSYFLSQDPQFQHRIQAALVAACISIANEGWAVAFHRERSTFVAQVLLSFTGSNSWTIAFAITASTDSSCLSDATQSGTVVLTNANAATQALLVTDAHIDNAIASEFNSFIRLPAN